MTVRHGWTWVEGSPKWHYFEPAAVRSICGKFGAPVDTRDFFIAASDALDCKVCKRRAEQSLRAAPLGVPVRDQIRAEEIAADIKRIQDEHAADTAGDF